MERTARPPIAPLPIARLGDRQSLRIHLDDGVERGTPPVDVVDASEELLGDRASGAFAGAHRALKLGHGDFFELERRGSEGRGPRAQGRGDSSREWLCCAADTG